MSSPDSPANRPTGHTLQITVPVLDLNQARRFLLSVAMKPSEKSVYYNFDQVREAAAGQWHDILSALSGLDEALKHGHRKHVACPHHESKHKGVRDGFRLFDDYQETGGGICSTCGGFSDGFKLLAWDQGWDVKDTFGHVAEYLRVPPVSGEQLRARKVEKRVVKPQPYTPVYDASQAKRLSELWNESLELEDNQAAPARQYFANRGIPLSEPIENLRFHPELEYWQRKLDHDGEPTDDFERVGTYPGLVMRLISPEGKPVTLHRTYLTCDGKKADVPSPKKQMRGVIEPVTGGAVRLFPATTFVGLTEGLETALAVRAATGLPVWPTLNTALLAGFRPPEGMVRIIGFGDLDRSTAGQKAMDDLAEQLAGSDVRFTYYMPPGPIPPDAKGVDWLDVYNQSGRREFPAVAVVPAARKPQRASPGRKAHQIHPQQASA